LCEDRFEIGQEMEFCRDLPQTMSNLRFSPSRIVVEYGARRGGEQGAVASPFAGVDRSDRLSVSIDERGGNRLTVLLQESEEIELEPEVVGTLDVILSVQVNPKHILSVIALNAIVIVRARMTRIDSA